MDNPSSAHPPDHLLRAFGLGQLEAAEAEKVAEHLDGCRDCSETMAGLADDTFVSLVRKSPEPRVGQQTEVQATMDSQSGVIGELAALAKLPTELREHPRYEIRELIGRGGMGDVYMAQHKVMNRKVALKVIRPELVRNASAVDRFQREVQAAARLHHGNIVTAHDAEQAGDVHFLVMEFVDGTDLSQVVQHRGALPVAEACDYVCQAAAGLEHAHQLGMVHRDIKPHNLMLTGRGEIKILDFGLANFVNEVISDEIGNEPPTGAHTTFRALHQLTRMGTMMGTPDYVAPEQAADACTADIRSDIYSLGCTLTFLLTGKPLFEGASVTDKLKSHAEQQPPKLADTCGDTPPELQRVVDRMLAKDPSQRFQTPSEVADALAPFTRPAAAPPRQRTPRMVLAAAAAILLAGVIYITTDKGRIEIRTDVDDVDVVVSRGGKEIRTIDLSTGSQVTWMPSGDYSISLKQDRNDIQITPKGFALSRWGKQIISLTRSAETSVASRTEQSGSKVPAGAMSETVFTGYNGSFEVTKSGLPVSWSFYTPRTVPDGDFDIVMDKTDFKEGEQSLKFVVRQCKPTGGRLSPGFFAEYHSDLSPPSPFDTLPGETYKISFWAKNAGSEFVFKARGVSAMKGNPGVVIRSKDTIDEWRRFECTYTIPPKMWLRLELNVLQPGTFWIDDVQIVKVKEEARLPDDQRLQGRWVPISAKFRGHDVTAEQLARMAIELNGTRALMTDPDSGRELPGTFAIDATRSPKHIDFIAPDGKERLPGIFEFYGEQLKLAWCDGDYARPTDFEPAETPDHMTAVFRRVPESAPATAPQDEPVRPFVPDKSQLDAVQAAEAYLSVMDDGKFGELWNLASSLAKPHVTRDQVSQTYQKLRDTFGKATQRTLTRVELYDEFPGLPKGRYALVQYKTDCERQKELWEVLLLYVDQDTRWHVNSYQISLEPPLFPNANPAPVIEQKKQAALIAAQEWLKLVDVGQYAESWKVSAKINRDGVSQQQMVDVYNELFKPLGKLASREHRSSEYTTQLPRAPMGEYAVIQFRTRFTDQRIIETVVLTRESDGDWRVSGYFHADDNSAPPIPQRAGLLTNPPRLPPGGLPGGKNLIVDHSLEETPMGQLPKGWFAWLNDGPDFKCEVVEGGFTGKHCLQISGTGTRGVVFATSIPLDRTKRFALKGRVKVEGESGTWAVIKLNYFNNTGWLGMDDRAGVTTSDLDWKLLEKTDAGDRYPGATLLVPTCHIEGNGTAWFDDLEVIAYDRDKLPDDFDAKHGRNNRMK